MRVLSSYRSSHWPLLKIALVFTALMAQAVTSIASESAELKRFEEYYYSHDHPMGRQTAISTLDSIVPRPRWAIELVTKVLATDTAPFVRSQAARTLGFLISGIPSVELGIRKGDVHKTTDPAAILSAADSNAVAALLKSAAHDADRGVQMEAIDALTRIRPPADRFLPILIKTAQTGFSFRPRRMAIDAIRLYGESARSAESELRTILSIESDPRVRVAGIRALDALGDLSKDAIAILAKLEVSDSDWSVRSEASKTLLARGQQSQISERDKALGSNPKSKREMDLLLQAVRSTTTSPYEPFPAEESWWGINDRGRALIKLSMPAEGAELQEYYVTLLDDADISIRAAAATAQWRLKDRRVIPKLRQCLKDVPVGSGNSAPRGAMTTHGVWFAKALIMMGDCDSAKEIVSKDELIHLAGLIFTDCKAQAVPHLLERSKKGDSVGQMAGGFARQFGLPQRK